MRKGQRKKGVPHKRQSEVDLIEELKLPDGFGRKIRSYRAGLISALDKIGTVQNGTTAMEHVAKCFYEDKACMLAILQHLLPRLKSVEAKIDSASPFRLMIDMTPQGTDDDDEEKVEL